jgi:hypothetical protein
MQHYVYDVSHALTQGIRIRKLERAIDPQAEKTTASYCPIPKYKPHVWHILGRDWYPTREEAIAVANDRRQRAIRAAERKIAKLQAMTFDDCPNLPTTTEPPC